MTPALSFFLKIALAIWDLLWFHTKFMVVCSISVKNDIGILIAIALNLYMVLGTMDILTILILPIPEYRISFFFFFLFLLLR